MKNEFSTYIKKNIDNLLYLADRKVGIGQEDMWKLDIYLDDDEEFCQFFNCLTTINITTLIIKKSSTVLPGKEDAVIILSMISLGF